jgi:hypothetical protein
MLSYAWVEYPKVPMELTLLTELRGRGEDPNLQCQVIAAPAYRE